jgi:hypothetical protein
LRQREDDDDQSSAAEHTKRHDRHHSDRAYAYEHPGPDNPGQDHIEPTTV